MTLSSTYDTKAASTLLESLARERASDKLAGLQLSELEGSTIYHLCKPVDVGNAKRLVFREGDSEDEEIVWHIQGIISSLDLPPFYPRERTKYKARFLRQSLRLTGLGTATFAAAMHNLKDVVATFSRSVTAIQPPTFVDVDEDGIYMDVSNRYFSFRHDDRGGKAVQMPPAIDPTGTLAKMVPDTHYYGEENVVQYLELIPATRGSRKSSVETQPVTFKKGDIVEIQVTMSAVKQLKDWKLVATLRCVTLLDGRFAQTTMRNDVTFGSAYKPRIPHKTLKRKCGADPDDVSVSDDGTESATNKIRKMEIDDAEERTVPDTL